MASTPRSYSCRELARQLVRTGYWFPPSTGMLFTSPFAH